MSNYEILKSIGTEEDPCDICKRDILDKESFVYIETEEGVFICKDCFVEIANELGIEK